MKIWIVMISKKGGYTFHSAHTDEEKAKAFAECKQADGLDTSILEVFKTDLEELKEAIEKLFAPK